MTIDLSVFGFVLLSAAANVLGGLIIFIKKDWSRQNLHALMALSAGLLIAIAVADLIPEALEANSNSAIYILVGIMTIFFFQQFVASHFHFGEETHKHKATNSAVFGAFSGLMIHTFFDGLAIVFSFKVDLHLGIVVLIAVLIHKIPDGLTISSIVFTSFQDRKKAVLSAVCLGASTLLGAFSAVILSGLPLPFEQITAIAISFSAGVFIYVGGTDLLPVVNATDDRITSIFFILGIVLYYLLIWSFHILVPAVH